MGGERFMRDLPRTVPGRSRTLKPIGGRFGAGGAISSFNTSNTTRN